MPLVSFEIGDEVGILVFEKKREQLGFSGVGPCRTHHHVDMQMPRCYICVRWPDVSDILSK